MKKVILLVVILATTTVLLAQTKHSKWAVGLHTVQTNYQGDLGNGFFDFDKFNPGIGLSLSHYLSSTFDIGVKASWSHVAYEDTDGTFAYGTGGYADLVGGAYNKNNWRFYGGMWTAIANLKFKLNNDWLLKENSKVAPFITGGFGFTVFNQTSVRDMVSSKKYSNLALYYGAGLKILLTDNLSMNIEAGIYNPMTDVYDGVDKDTAPGWVPAKTGGKGDVDKSDDQFLQFSFGLTYNFGKKQDADGDGVADKKDKCPNTPVGIEVDENGCPVDTDGDGVADYQDRCPNIAGTIKGCPDADGDGVVDKNDECPKVKGLKELKGCPDKDDDKDGVLNLSDKCPNTPKGVTVDKNGCPVDTDGDGVADYLDKCPKVAGNAKNKGCPEVQKKLDAMATQIYFKSGKSTLKSESYPILNNIVSLLSKHKDSTFSIEIAGYTDSTGSDKLNQKISEKRATVVRDYLVGKGISASKLTAKGYGEANPVATNKTAAGRALNRRTEIKIK